MAKGIVVDIGFNAKFDELSSQIKSELKKIDYDDSIKLSEAFENQEKQIKNKLEELAREIDKVVNRVSGDDAAEQLSKIATQLGSLQRSTKALVDSMPTSVLNKYGENLKKIEADAAEVAIASADAQAAVKGLNDATNENVDVEGLRKQREEVDRLRSSYNTLQDLVDKLSGNTELELVSGVSVENERQLDNFVDGIEKAYQSAEKAQSEYTDAVASGDKKAIQDAARTYAEMLNELTRYVDTAESIMSQNNFNKLTIESFKGEDIPLSEFRFQFKDDYNELIATLALQMNNISNIVQDMTGKMVSELNAESEKMEDVITLKIPIGISTAPEKLIDNAVDVIKQAQKTIKNEHSIDVKVNLTSSYSEFTKGQLKKDVQKISSLLDKATDKESKEAAKELKTLVSNYSNNAFLYTVGVQTEKAQEEMKKFQDYIEDSMLTINNNLKLTPTIEVTEEARTSLENQLNKISSDTFHITVDTGATTDSNGKKKKGQVEKYLSDIAAKVKRIRDSINSNQTGSILRAFIDLGNGLSGPNKEVIQNALNDAFSPITNANREIDAFLEAYNELVSEGRKKSTKKQDTGLSEEEIALIAKYNRAMSELAKGFNAVPKAISKVTSGSSKYLNEIAPTLVTIGNALNGIKEAYQLLSQNFTAEWNVLLKVNGEDATLSAINSFEEMKAKLEAESKESSKDKNNGLNELMKVNTQSLIEDIQKIVNKMNEVYDTTSLNTWHSSFTEKLNDIKTQFENLFGKDNINVNAESLSKFAEVVEELRTTISQLPDQIKSSIGEIKVQVDTTSQEVEELDSAFKNLKTEIDKVVETKGNKILYTNASDLDGVIKAYQKLVDLGADLDSIKSVFHLGESGNSAIVWSNMQVALKNIENGYDATSEAVKEEEGVVETAVQSELGELQKLENKLRIDIPNAIEEKNKAFQGEISVVDNAVDEEIISLSRLVEAMREISDQIDTETKALANSIYSNIRNSSETSFSALEHEIITTLESISNHSKELSSAISRSIKDGAVTGASALRSEVKDAIESINDSLQISITPINVIDEAESKISIDNIGKHVDSLKDNVVGLGSALPKGKSGTPFTSLANLAKSLEDLNEAMDKIKGSSLDQFIEKISGLLEKGEELSNLAAILKSSAKQINEAGKTVKENEHYKEAQIFLQAYEEEIREIANISIKDSGFGKVIIQDLKATKSGLVEVTSLVETAEGEYRRYTSTVDKNLDVLTKSSEGQNAYIIKQIEAYKKLTELFNNSTGKGAGVNGKKEILPGSDKWDAVVDLIQKFGINIEDVTKVVRQLNDEGDESFKVFTSLSEITLGMNSKDILQRKDVLVDTDKTVKTLNADINTLESKIKAAAKGGTTSLEEAGEALKSLMGHLDEVNQASLVDGGLGFNANELNTVLNKASISLKSVGELVDGLETKINSKARPQSTINALNELKRLATELSQIDILDPNNFIKSKDVIVKFAKKFQEVSKLAKDTNNTFAKSDSVEKLMLKISKLLDTNGAMSVDLKAKLEALFQVLKNGGNQLPIAEFKELGNIFLQLENKMYRAGKTGKSFFQMFQNNIIQKTAGTLAQYFSLYDMIRYAREMTSTVQSYDTALTEMRKVSNETIESLKEYQKTTYSAGESVGATALTIQNSTADWLRLGEAIDEASESAKVSSILFNVSEFESIDEATESLVAMSQAYQELGKMDIIDVLNNLGNNFSISTDGLAQALQVSASALKTAQNDFYEASALVVAGNAVVQDPSKTGAGLRTIALRLTGKMNMPEHIVIYEDAYFMPKAS